MRYGFAQPARLPVRTRALLRRLRRDRRGVTTIEFAMIAAPFFFIVLAIMTIGMQFLVLHLLEKGVADASRQIRTGEAQTAGLTLGNFRQLVCDSAGSLIACDDHLVVHVLSANTFVGLTPPPTCVTNGGLTPPPGQSGDPLASATGQENMKVLVTACYNWEGGMGLWKVIAKLISPIPFDEGMIVLSAASVFQTEPYK